MSFVVIAGERYALPIGETLLGGSADDALAAPELSSLPPSAVVEVMPDGRAMLRATWGGQVLVDGEPMTGELALRHGLKAEIGGVALVFGDIAANGSTSHVASIDPDVLAALGGLSRGEPTANTGGRLTMEGGQAIEIPSSGLTIGRNPACGLPLADKSVSRHHATIAPAPRGYMLTDTSVNGVVVNDRKVDGSVVLAMRDIIRIGGVELRFEADPLVLEPPRAAASAPAARDLVQRRGQLLAALEVASIGALHGTRFRIERPVVHIGRGKHNEVRIADDSISSSHATISRRGGRWVVLDLGSTNGSYVDGERITERALDGAAELRFGNVKLRFRAVAAGSDDEPSARAEECTTSDLALQPQRKRL